MQVLNFGKDTFLFKRLTNDIKEGTVKYNILIWLVFGIILNDLVPDNLS
uniref:Uncharacterized protein n=1 Tax=Arsenophonus endosymbiont of Trialeurodes vaporariorum TaxID=235567 RepID=A0A3B0LYT4_9GAMM